MPMKAEDHSECSPEDCQHKRKQVGEEKEAAYYEEKRRLRQYNELHGLRHGAGEGPVNVAASPVMQDVDRGSAEWRARKVALIELELLEAREDMVAHGDPMPLQDVRNVVGDALRLLEHKNQQYRDAWRKQGYMGNLGRIQSKAERLKSLLWRDADGDGYPLPANYTRDGETVVDTLLDLINLSAMMVANWTEENRWG